MKKTFFSIFLTFAILVGLSIECRAQEKTDSVQTEKKKPGKFKQYLAKIAEQEQTDSITATNDNTEKEATAKNDKEISLKEDRERSTASLEKQIQERDAENTKLKAESAANKADADDLAMKFLSVKTEVKKAEKKEKEKAKTSVESTKPTASAVTVVPNISKKMVSDTSSKKVAKAPVNVEKDRPIKGHAIINYEEKTYNIRRSDSTLLASFCPPGFKLGIHRK